MKKIFTLFAAMLMTMAANAEAVTEKFGSANNSEKDTEVVCPAFTIAGNYVASGSSKVNVYDGDKGMKMRANQTDNTLILTVKENTKITAIKIGMVTNDSEQTIPVSDVKVDGTSVALSYPIATFNLGNAEGTAVIDLSDIAATETIGIVFDLADYTAKNKQVFIAGEVTYVDSEGGDPVVSSNVWTAPGEAPAAGSVIVDNDLMIAKTVYETKVAAEDFTYDGVDFTNRMQVRVAAWPSADNLNGTDNGGSTSIVLEAKQDLDVTFVFRRQSANSAYTAGDGKDIAVFSHPDATRVSGEMVEINDLDGSYGNCAEKFTLTAGTYTVAAKGTTLGLFGFIYSTHTTGISDITVSEANGEAVYYNLNGVKVANPANGLYIKVQGGKATKVLVK